MYRNYDMFVVGVRVEEDGESGDDAGDDGDCGFVDGQVVVLDEGGGDRVECEEEEGENNKDRVYATLLLRYAVVGHFILN